MEKDRREEAVVLVQLMDVVGTLPKRAITLALPKPLITKIATQTTTIPITTGVGLVEPTIPVRLGSDPANGRITRFFSAPAETQSGHCHPTCACCMQSVQMGLSQWAQTTEAARSEWFDARRGAHRMPASNSARTRRATCSGSLRSQRPGEPMYESTMRAKKSAAASRSAPSAMPWRTR